MTAGISSTPSRSLKDLLWENWEHAGGDLNASLEEIRSSIGKLGDLEKNELMVNVDKIVGYPLAEIESHTPLESRVEKLLLTLEYALFSFDSGSIEMSRRKIDRFLATSGVNPEIVRIVYPNAMRIGEIKIDQ